jgi:hypothetical protein
MSRSIATSRRATIATTVTAVLPPENGSEEFAT